MESLEAARVPLLSVPTAGTTAPPKHPLRLAVDQPIRAAIVLGRGGLGATLAAGAAGLCGVAASVLVVQHILATPAQLPLNPLPPLLDAMTFVVPAAVGGAWLRVRVSLRVIAGAFSVGLLQAAIVSASLLPLAVFIAAVTDLAAMHAVSPLAHTLIAALAVPFAALLTLVHRLSETVTRLDARPAVAQGAQVASVAVCAVFVLRALSQLGG